MPYRSYLGNQLGNQMLDLLWNGGWIGCHEADPTDIGILDTEVAGSGYTRLRTLFTPPSNKTIANDRLLHFVNLPATRVLWLASWTEVTAGQLHFRIPMFDWSAPESEWGIEIAAGGELIIPAGDLALSI
jgi:hypothetical protein